MPFETFGSSLPQMMTAMKIGMEMMYDRFWLFLRLTEKLPTVIYNTKVK